MHGICIVVSAPKGGGEVLCTALKDGLLIIKNKNKKQKRDTAALRLRCLLYASQRSKDKITKNKPKLSPILCTYSGSRSETQLSLWLPQVVN